MKTKFDDFLNEGIFDFLRKESKEIDKSKLSSLEEIVGPIIDELTTKDFIINKTGKGSRIGKPLFNCIVRICEILNVQLRRKKIVLNCIENTNKNLYKSYEELKEERELIEPYFAPFLEYILITTCDSKYRTKQYFTSLDDIRNAMAPIVHRIFSPDDPYGEEEWEDMDESVKNNEDPLNIKDCVIFYDSPENAVYIANSLASMGYVFYCLDKVPTFSLDNRWDSFVPNPYGMKSAGFSFVYDFVNGKSSSMTDKRIISCDKILNMIDSGTRYKKIERPEVDPYGEEDWGYTVQENNNLILELLKDKAIFYNTLEEMINIALILKQIGLKTYTNINEMKILEFEYYLYRPERNYFVRSESFDLRIKSGEFKNLKKLSYLDFMNLFGKKYKKIERPEVDPYGEEDWGYTIQEGHNIPNLPSQFEVLVMNRNEYFIVMEILEKWGIRTKFGNLPTKMNLSHNVPMYIIYQGEHLEWNPRHWRYEIIDIKDLISLDSNSSKFKKIKKPDIDPYDEEDWGYSVQENVVNLKSLRDYHIRIKDEDEWKRMMVFLEEQGYKWNSGHKPTYHLNHAFTNFNGRGPFLRDIIYVSNKLGISTPISYSTEKRKNPGNVVDASDLLSGKIKIMKTINSIIDPYGEEDWDD